MTRRLLMISGGHGEDNHAAHVIRTLRAMSPDIAFAAMPLVGLGKDYTKLGVPILGPVKALPSGGFAYMSSALQWQDLRAGLIGLILKKLYTLKRRASDFDAVFAVGDILPQTFARWSGLPYASFISCVTAYHGDLRPDALFARALRHPRCRRVATKDRHTAEVLSGQGFSKVVFAGMPSIDWLVPEGRDLALAADGGPVVALLPGSRPPEALRNLSILMRFARAASGDGGPAPQFRAALVPALRAEVPDLAAARGWTWSGGWLRHRDGTAIFCPEDAFADIAHRADIAVGLAGLAVEQIVALGKPVIQFPGEGPQFVYEPFVRRQQLLLGPSAQTIGTAPPDAEALAEGVRRMRAALADPAYLAGCRANAEARFGGPGNARRLAAFALEALAPPDPEAEMPRHGPVADAAGRRG